jgi:hypothetical protein
MQTMLDVFSGLISKIFNLFTKKNVSCANQNYICINTYIGIMFANIAINMRLVFKKIMSAKLLNYQT